MNEVAGPGAEFRRESGLASSVESRERCQTGNQGRLLAGPHRLRRDWRFLLADGSPLAGSNRGKEPSAWKIWSHFSICYLGDILWGWGRKQTNKLLSKFEHMNLIHETTLWRNYCFPHFTGASQVALVIKNPPANVRDVRDAGLIPRLGRSTEQGHGNPLQYSCRENPSEQRNLAGYSPWSRKESDTMKQLSMHTHRWKG